MNRVETLAISDRVASFPVPGSDRVGSGRSAVWLAHLTGGQGVGSSNLPAPTGYFWVYGRGSRRWIYSRLGSALPASNVQLYLPNR